MKYHIVINLDDDDVDNNDVDTNDSNDIYDFFEIYHELSKSF